MNLSKVLSGLGLLGSLLVLVACGSGDGGNDKTDTATTLSGAYSGTATASSITKEFVSAITPSGNFYAIYFLSAIPDIYTGAVTRGMNGNASISALRMFPNITSTSVVSQSASVSGASSAGYVLTPLTGATDRTPSSFNATALATSSDLSTSAWTGTWSDSKNTATMFTSTLTLGSAVQLDGTNFFTDCYLQNPPTLSATAITGSTLLSVTLNIPTNTACVRSGSNLTGIAFIYPVTADSVTTLRLDMVMVDSTGSGITFRGRPTPP